MITYILAPARPSLSVAQARENSRALRIRRKAELFGLCRVCGKEHLTQSCPDVPEERRRQERKEGR